MAHENLSLNELDALSVIYENQTFDGIDIHDALRLGADVRSLRNLKKENYIKLMGEDRVAFTGKGRKALSHAILENLDEREEILRKHDYPLLQRPRDLRND